MIFPDLGKVENDKAAAAEVKEKYMEPLEIPLKEQIKIAKDKGAEHQEEQGESQICTHCGEHCAPFSPFHCPSLYNFS